MFSCSVRSWWIRPAVTRHLMSWYSDLKFAINDENLKNELNFKFEFSIKDAIRDLRLAFENKTLKNSLNNEKYFNLKRMKNIDLK